MIIGDSTPSQPDDIIRAKLLNRLGIYQSDPAQQSAEQRIEYTRKESLKHAALVPSLKSNKTKDTRTLRETLDHSDRAVETSSKNLRFHPHVVIIPIPSHHDYSNRIRKVLWSDSEEILENADRNRVEFATEGWDWQSVLEDDELFLDQETGERVHPCWFDRGLVLSGIEEGKQERDSIEQSRSALSPSNRQLLSE